jgi:hypothetical protein
MVEEALTGEILDTAEGTRIEDTSAAGGIPIVLVIQGRGVGELGFRR